MRKLSTIKGKEGIAVIGDALPIIERLVKNAGNKNDNEGTISFVGRILKANPADALHLMAIIDGVDVSMYEDKSLIDILSDITDMINDPELMSLFS